MFKISQNFAKIIKFMLMIEEFTTSNEQRGNKAKAIKKKGETLYAKK